MTRYTIGDMPAHDPARYAFEQSCDDEPWRVTPPSIEDSGRDGCAVCGDWLCAHVDAEFSGQFPASPRVAGPAVATERCAAGPKGRSSHVNPYATKSGENHG